MPTVGKKKFDYSSEGRAEAAKAKKEAKAKEGKVKAEQPS